MHYVIIVTEWNNFKKIWKLIASFPMDDWQHFSRELNEKLYDVISEIAQVKKLCTKEMNQNENLTLFKNRLERDTNICKHQLETESRKRDNMEKILAQTQEFAEQTEKECEKINTVSNFIRKM